MGGDCIDDVDALRAGRTDAVLGHRAVAPSTVGAFLRPFLWGHARQLDGVTREILRRAWTLDDRPVAPSINPILRVMDTYTIRALGADTWDAFAALAGKHNGVWGGCWCTWFHGERAEKGSGAAGNRALKRRLVEAAGAHAALVYDGDAAVGWCQYGPPVELPNIYHRRQVETPEYQPPDYRLTCLFVDRDYRRRGVAAAAVRGALDLIAQAGGGVVEAYPQDTQGEKVSASFLYNGTRSLFEKAGFRYRHAKGKAHAVMRTTIQASQPTRQSSS